MPNRPIKFEFEADTDKFERSMKDAADDTEKLEKALKDIPKATDKMAADSAKDFDRLGDEAADAGSEVGSEFKQNLGQTLASGGSVGDLLSETLGGLVAGLKGPLGLAAAGVAGLAALAFNEVKRQAEELQAFTESLSGALASLYEQGIKTQDKMRQLTAFNTFLEEQSDKIQDLEDDWAAAGVDQDKYLASIFQGGPALDVQREKLLGILDELNKQSLTAEGLTVEQLKQNAAAQELLKYLDAQAAEQSDLTGEMQNQASASQELARQLGLVDTNGDGIITDADKIADSLTVANTQAAGLKQNLKDIPSMIGVEIRYTASGNTGGAFATTGGGQLVPKYGQKP